MSDTRDSSFYLFAEAEKRGLSPQWLTDFGCFTIALENRRIPVFEMVSVLNNALSVFLSRNKLLTRLAAQATGIRNIPFLAPKTLTEAQQFWRLHGPLIAKPIAGWKGQETYRLDEEDQLASLEWGNLILERYTEGIEVRYLVMDGEVLGVQEKTLSPTEEKPWRKHWRNVDHIHHDSQLVSESTKLASHLGLRLTAVDWIRDQQGAYWFLETNSAPAIFKFHKPDEGEPIDMARLIWPALLEEYQRQPELGWPV